MFTVPKLCCCVFAMAEGVRSNACMNADRATIATLAVVTITIAQAFLFERLDIQHLYSAPAKTVKR